jgi:hypothetical protein
VRRDGDPQRKWFDCRAILVGQREHHDFRAGETGRVPAGGQGGEKLSRDAIIEAHRPEKPVGGGVPHTPRPFHDELIGYAWEGRVTRAEEAEGLTRTLQSSCAIHMAIVATRGRRESEGPTNNRSHSRILDPTPWPYADSVDLDHQPAEQVPHRLDKAGVSRSVIEGNWSWPMHGVRHPPRPGTSGWYIWTGELLPDADFFLPWHVSHVLELMPSLEPLLELPPGTRFLIAPGYQDIWEDQSLLEVD